jgi:UMF1 family MFS transporter
MEHTRAAVAADPRTQRAWTMYDWANSVYSLVITTAIFPIFYNAVTTARDASGTVISDEVNFLGATFINTQLYSYVLAASFVVVIILSPLLSGMADYAGKKLLFMKVFAVVGSLACAGLAAFNPEHLEWSMVALFVANIGFWGSLGFYNAFLPEIAPPEDHDRLGARGYVMGYLGSLILLLVCLAMIMGIGKHTTRWAFVLVGVWWIAWAQPAFKRLPRNPYGRTSDGNLLLHGFAELRGVARELRGQPALKRYLMSFFIVSMAVQTIMLMASSFGIKEVKLSDTQLIVAIIAVQLLAIPGAFLMAWLSSRIGNLRTLAVCLAVWVGVCIYAYAFVTDVNGFFVAAGIIGFMMGGTQSMNRSTYSKMLPETQDHASYFSFYEVLEKGGLIIGMFSWGTIEGLTGSMRTSVLALILFFVAALAVLLSVPRGGTRAPAP